MGLGGIRSLLANGEEALIRWSSPLAAPPEGVAIEGCRSNNVVGARDAEGCLGSKDMETRTGERARGSSGMIWLGRNMLLSWSPQCAQPSSL